MGLIDSKLLQRCRLPSKKVGGWIYGADDHTDPALPLF